MIITSEITDRKDGDVLGAGMHVASMLTGGKEQAEMSSPLCAALQHAVDAL